MNTNYGLIHLYYGDGKGKTSMAIGQAIRCAGAGSKVLFTRFLKNDHSSEINILEKIPLIEMNKIEKDFGFYFNMTDSEKLQAKNFYTNTFLQTIEPTHLSSFDLLVLDEINVAISLHLVPEKLVLNFLKEKPKSLEVILTGRNPSDNLIQMADYASEILKIKHPFDNGISARLGIEY